VDLAIEAIARCPGVRLVLAGSGNERAALETRMKELGVGAQVSFIGPRTGPEKNWLLQNAYAMLMPSRGWEGSPLAALEAAAAGKALIASRITGLDDIVRDGVTGELFAEESVDELTASIRRLWADAALAERWGAAARAHAETFDLARATTRYLELYRELIADRRAPRCINEAPRIMRRLNQSLLSPTQEKWKN
jgi:glycosyltransferase involved in cell wall biosynthesis